ncbi:hypothetical protein GX51_05358 [Blastomyces parvus]|uniref:Allergen Asp f 4 n=1 Tax=Blastomyces parvus TaxID=2060905 RepID=A0A2B7WXK7_9EURO|nr:hypothetical protein GX51_05358 [Blastomyces parvus]
MQLKTVVALLGALAPLSLAQPHGHQHRHLSKRLEWNTVVSEIFSTAGFGGRSIAGSGEIDTYAGNVGSPWGSNIIEIPESAASKYKYVAQIQGQNTKPWTVVFWNKMGPDGKLTGHYGNSALTFTLNPGETKYVAFDENTQGGFGAYPGPSLPKNIWGGYACTWGEFDFGSIPNKGWSGFDVSAIQAQLSKLPVQGMKICQIGGGGVCSIAKDGGGFDNAYQAQDHAIGGIGGNLTPGPVRLQVTIDYHG